MKCNDIPDFGPLIAYQHARLPGDPPAHGARRPLPPGLGMRQAQTLGIFKSRPRPSPPGGQRLTHAATLAFPEGRGNFFSVGGRVRGVGSGQTGCGVRI